MDNKYFNYWEFSQAHSFRINNPVEAILKFKEYVEKYPEDYCGYIYYASNLITIGEFEKADKIIEYAQNLANNDQKFITKEWYKMKALTHDILFNRLRLLSYQEKYEELYRVLEENEQEIKKMDVNNLSFYCKQKVGKITGDNSKINTYLFKQIMDYNESEFLEHIQRHLADYNKDLDEPNKNIFVPNFPINEVIKEIRKYIPSDKRLYSGFFENTYIFKYNECGRDNNRLVNYFKVVCFNNTSNIITIFPLSECENLPHIDLNYLIKDTTPKIKRMSKVEKFNQRYRR